MSQIGLFVRSDVAVLCGDTILNFEDNKKGICHKVFCSDNAIMIGISGDIESNLIFFGGFLGYAEEGLKINNEVISGNSFLEFVKILDGQFMKLSQKEDLSNFNIGVVVAGYDGNGIAGVAYQIKEKEMWRKNLKGSSTNFQIQMFGIMTDKDEFKVRLVSDDCVKNIACAFQEKLNKLVETSPDVNNVMDAYAMAIHRGELIWWKIESKQ